MPPQPKFAVGARIRWLSPDGVRWGVVKRSYSARDQRTVKRFLAPWRRAKDQDSYLVSDDDGKDFVVQEKNILSKITE